ncbi:MAG: hypothetical protein ACLU84_06630 [Clostridia bacterium]
MVGILKNIKEMIRNNETDKAIKYIDKILSDNKNADIYIDELVNELK